MSSKVIKRKNCTYSASVMELTLKEAKSGEEKPWNLAKKFGLPYQTLKYKFDGKHKGKVGVKSILTANDEHELANWIETRARMGYPMDKREFFDAAVKIAEQRGNQKFSTKGPSRMWLKGFLNRHPGVTFRKPESIKKAATLVTLQDINDFIQNLIENLEQQGVLDFLQEHPENFVNMDETGFEFNAMPDKVMTLTSIPHTYYVEPAKHNERVTVTVSIGADGHMYSPQVILKESFSKMEDIAYASGKAGMKCYFSKTTKGWQNSITFFEYVKKVVAEMRERDVKGPILLLVDGYPAHLLLDLQKYCNENDVIYVILLPNSTHLIQPLDVAVFKPVKTEFKKQASDFRQKFKKTEINEEDFITILAKTLKASVTPELVKTSFETTGLFPLKRDQIKESRILTRPHISTPPASQDFDVPPIQIEKQGLEFHQSQLKEIEMCRKLGMEVQKEKFYTDNESQVCLMIIQQQFNVLERLHKEKIQNLDNRTAATSSQQSESIEQIFTIPQVSTQKRKRQFKMKSCGVMSNLDVILAAEETRLEKQHAKDELENRKQARLENREINRKIKQEKVEEKIEKQKQVQKPAKKQAKKTPKNIKKK